MSARRLPLLAVLLLAVIAVAAGVSRPGAAPRSAVATGASSGAAVRATLFCPDLRTIAGTLGTTVVVGTPAPADGGVTVAAAASASGARPLLGPRQQTARFTGPLTGPLVLQAQGPLSSGLVAEQVARANKTADRGWAEARCQPPRSDEWFVGSGTRPGQTPEVVLANPADTRAIVDVTVLTPAGLVTSSAGGNLVLEPHTLQRVPVTSLAPGAAVTAVHVQTQVGEVSAAVRDTRVSGTTPLGTDWVPLSEPTLTATMPGVPATVGGSPVTRTLFVANTGSDDTTVQVRVTAGNDTFVPSGLDAKVVPAQTVVAVPLSAALGARAGSVRVTSQSTSTGVASPIVATVLVDAAATGSAIHEITYVGPAEPIEGPALVPDIPLPADTSDDLFLAAPDGAGAVRVAVSRGVGRPLRVTQVPVAAGTVRGLDLRGLGAVADGYAIVTPLPGSGPVYASRLIQEKGALGPLVSTLTLGGAPTSVPVPATAELPIGSVS